MPRKNLYVIGGIAVLVLLGVFAYVQYSRDASAGKASASAQQIGNALLQTQAAASTSVPATSNPVKAATPAVNPVDATNPFNDTGSGSAAASGGYQNPF